MHIIFKLCNHLSAKNINSEGKDQITRSRVALLLFFIVFIFMRIETAGNCFFFFACRKGFAQLSDNHDTLPEQVHLRL